MNTTCRTSMVYHATVIFHFLVQGSIQIPIIITFNNDSMEVLESEMELHINVSRCGEMKRPLTLIVEDKSMSAKSCE